MGRITEDSHTFDMPNLGVMRLEPLVLKPVDLSTLLVLGESMKPLKFTKPTKDK